MTKVVVAIQCDLVTKRCSGFLCMRAFYDGEEPMKEYDPKETRYMSLTCGGCNGGCLTAKLENLSKWLKKEGIEKDEVAVHLASCICTESYHRPPCMFENFLKQIITKHGYRVVLGTHFSEKASERRAAGIYKPIR